MARPGLQQPNPPRTTLDEIKSLLEKSLEMAGVQTPDMTSAAQSLPQISKTVTQQEMSARFDALVSHRPHPEDMTKGGRVGLQQTTDGSFPGQPRGTDTISAWLTKDEFVVPKGPAQEHRAFLEMITSSFASASRPSNPSHNYATGGPVYMAQGGGVGRDVGLLKDVFGAFDATNPTQMVSHGISALTTIISGTVGAIDEFPEALKKATKNMFAPDTLGGMINIPGNLAKDAGDWLSNVPGMGTVGQVISIFGEYANLIGDSVDGLRKWNKELYEANTRFADVAGGMASVHAQQSVRDIILAQERGERLAPTAEFHATRKHELEMTLSKFEDAFVSFQNMFAGGVSRSFNEILNNIRVGGPSGVAWGGSNVGGVSLPELATSMTDILNQLAGKPDSAQQAMAELENITAQGPRTYGRPKRFGTP